MLATSRSWTLAETMVVRRYPAGCKLFWRGSGQCSRMRCASPPLFLSYHWFLGALVGPLRCRIPKLIRQSKKRGNVMYNRLPTTACVSPPTRPIRSHARRSGLSWKRTRLIWINFSSGERAGRFAQAPGQETRRGGSRPTWRSCRSCWVVFPTTARLYPSPQIPTCFNRSGANSGGNLNG